MAFDPCLEAQVHVYGRGLPVADLEAGRERRASADEPQGAAEHVVEEAGDVSTVDAAGGALVAPVDPGLAHDDRRAGIVFTGRNGHRWCQRAALAPEQAVVAVLHSQAGLGVVVDLVDGNLVPAQSGCIAQRVPGCGHPVDGLAERCGGGVEGVQVDQQGAHLVGQSDALFTGTGFETCHGEGV